MWNSRYLRIGCILLTGSYILTSTRVLRVHVTSDRISKQGDHVGGISTTKTSISSISSLPTTFIKRQRISRSNSRLTNDETRHNNHNPTNKTIDGLSPPEEEDVLATQRHDDIDQKVGLNALSTLQQNTSIASRYDGTSDIAPSREKLQVQLDRIVSETGSPYQGHAMWELSGYLPVWMKEYFEWHKKERSKITHDSWRNGIHKVLVLQCRPTDKGNDRCDNLSQRFTIIPNLLREAHAMKRLLFIHWTDPTNLEEFLVPPTGGIDWRTPKWLKRAMLVDPSQAAWIKPEMPFSMFRTSDLPLLQVQPTFNTSFVETSYNVIIKTSSNGEEHVFSEIFHDCWRVFFRPTEVVVKILRKEIRRMKGMHPAEYVVIDLSFGRGDTPESVVRVSPANSRSNLAATLSSAMSCASRMQPDHPAGGLFLVMTDDPKIANEVAGLVENRAINVWTRQSNNLNISSRDARDYSTFVDLYLMGMGSCVISHRPTSSRGGRDWVYLASLVGYDSACYTDRDSLPFQSCEGNGAQNHVQTRLMGTTEDKKKHQQPEKQLHHFGEPMLGDGLDYVSLSPPKDWSTHASNDANKKGLPDWMVRYFAWHNHTRTNLSPSNWNSTKYLILGCFRSLPACGGISDRLKPLPMSLLEASRNKRLLLIWWERPKPLEEFFVPPKDGTGLDWTVPEWLKTKLQPDVRRGTIESSLASNFQQGDALLKGGRKKRVIVLKIQTPTAGEELYSEQADSESTYQDVFHELFARFFTPVPRLAGLIESTMQQHGLAPGQYSSAHLRAMYGNRDSRDAQELVELTVLGINCASNLQPGAPIYFASDTGNAVLAARDYAKLHSLPVASLDFNDDPIHLDKDLHWENRSVSEYDPTFVDLYMLSQSRCVAYSNGGYGTFGSLLSHDAQCNIRFFKGRKKIKKCQWMSADRIRQKLDLPNVTEKVYATE